MTVTTLSVPLLNANEDELLVAGLFVSEGDEVRAGQLIAALESTKATTDVEAPSAGFVRRLSIAEDQRVRVGDLICHLTETADEALPEPAAKSSANEDGVNATRRARELAAEHDIELSILGVDGIIKERDVRAYLDSHAPAAPAPSIEVPIQGGAEIVIWGAGGHARVIIDLIRESHRDLRIIGALDDGTSPPEAVLGVPVIGSSTRLPELRDRGLNLAALGIGAVTRNAVRRDLHRTLTEHGYRVPAMVHTRASVEPSARIAEGAQVFAGAIVGSNVDVGVNAIVNSGVVVSHDCRIADHVHLTPGAIVAGNVAVGEASVVGMGVTVYLGVTIGAGCTISNGVHVLRDVPDGTWLRSTQDAEGS